MLGRFLTLFGLGGGTLCPSCHVFAYICANMLMSALKNLTLLSYEFGKGQYTFYPVKLSLFVEKNKDRQKNQNSIRGDPYEPGQTPLWRTKVSKV